MLYLYFLALKEFIYKLATYLFILGQKNPVLLL